MAVKVTISAALLRRIKLELAEVRDNYRYLVKHTRSDASDYREKTALLDKLMVDLDNV